MIASFGAAPSVAVPHEAGTIPQSTNGRLFDVSADSPSDAWAVGDENTETTSFAMHWDGSTWNTVPLQLPGSVDNQLLAVKAISPTDAWVVGWYSNRASGGYRTVVEHWDGAQFSIVPSLNPRPNSQLLAVDATGPDDVWAVGGSGGRVLGGGRSRPIVEHWDGTGWQLVATTHLRSSLDAVSAVAPDDVWVGGTDLSRWDGSTWTRMWRNPGVQDQIAYLYRVQALSTAHAWLVAQENGPSTFAAQAQDGQLTNELNSCSYSGLGDIQVLADNDVWVVGGCYNDATGTIHAEIVHWNGATWKRIPNRPHGGLLGLDATSSSDIWAVGYYDTYPKELTLIEHYNGSIWTVVPS